VIGIRSWQFVVFIALLVILHFVLHLALGYGPVAPDLLTVAVLLSARRLSGAGAAVLGFGLGLIQDSLSLIAFGREALTYTLLGFIGARSRDLFVGDSLLFVGVYLFIGKWLHDIVYFLLPKAGTEPRGDALGRLAIQAPVGAVYCAVVGIAVLLIYRGVSGER
jgi:rod shape-determining protein MreD